LYGSVELTFSRISPPQFAFAIHRRPYTPISLVSEAQSEQIIVF
jgi:hypothetical protein